MKILLISPTMTVILCCEATIRIKLFRSYVKAVLSMPMDKVKCLWRVLKKKKNSGRIEACRKWIPGDKGGAPVVRFTLAVSDSDDGSLGNWGGWLWTLPCRGRRSSAGATRSLKRYNSDCRDLIIIERQMLLLLCLASR